MRYHRLGILFGLAAIIAAIGGSQAAVTEKKDPPKVEIKRIKVGNNVALEVEGDKRRVRIDAEVCLRDSKFNGLEHLLTRKRIKDHEAILTADIDARDLHLALTLAGAEPGKTVKFRPKLTAPTGTTVKIFLEYKDKDDKLIRVPAQQWIRNIKTKKDLHTDWVFAGSIFVPDPLDKKAKPFYGANDGDVISVVNFEFSCLDVPFLSTKDNADLDFEAHTDRIPALKTAVTVVLEPVLEKKK
jgi:hypothetical protein